jgi:hypothetical protein
MHSTAGHVVSAQLPDTIFLQSQAIQSLQIIQLVNAGSLSSIDQGLSAWKRMKGEMCEIPLTYFGFETAFLYQLTENNFTRAAIY